MTARVHTIGHSTRSAQDFVDLLSRNGIDLLVDVRRYPGSRRHPHFNREALADTLAEAGIRYRHAPELGGRRPARDDAKGDVAASPNRGWRNDSFRAYADHMADPEWQAGLARLMEEAEAAAVAIMCAEAVPWRCHRQLISDALVARGVDVRHITSASEPAPHALNEMARVDGEGRVSYPGEEPDQRDLFAS